MNEIIMIYFSMSKDTINIPHVKNEFMTSNLAFYVIFFECCIYIEFSDQRITNSREITKELFPVTSFKTARDEGFLKNSKIHISLLNDRSLFKVMGVSLKVLRGVKQAIVQAFPLVTTLNSCFLWSHLQNRATNTTKQSIITSNKLN